MPTNIEYYKIRIRLVSPLAVSSGENSHTDSDVQLDSKGEPIIPATAFAGAVRHYSGVECGDKNSFFGYIDNEISEESRVKFYDAVPVTSTYTSIRDSVKLENKLTVDGAKFDKEVVETAAEFITMFELHNASDSEKDDILSAIAALNDGKLRIGSKTSRGYGQIEVVNLSRAVFNLPDDREKWLEFSPYDYKSDKFYEDVTEEIKHREDDGKFTRIHLELKQNGAIAIRSYTVKNKSDIESADWIQLSTNDGVPVIPGTSWAGAFRHRFKEFSEGDNEFFRNVWGYVDEKNKTQQRSKISFSESRIHGGTSKLITRNSIDRFTAGTKDTSLYREKTIYNGRCSLDIDIRNDVDDIERCKTIISAVICDLDNGYLAVGGLTAVGRGLFTVEKITIDGDDVTAPMKKMDISAMIGGKEQ
jgi:CRISPR/Cas system CSM-associated protein Csm3 (group 7 of RAMP superfamily)